VASQLTGSSLGYVLAAFDGTDTDQGYISWAAQICAVLPCQRMGQACLAYQTPSGSLHAVTLAAEGMTAGHVEPEVVAYSSSQEQIMLTPGATEDGFSFVANTTEHALSAWTAAQYPLTSALVYGRVFQKDNLPYKCGVTSHDSTTTTTVSPSPPSSSGPTAQPTAALKPPQSGSHSTAQPTAAPTIPRTGSEPVKADEVHKGPEEPATSEPRKSRSLAWLGAAAVGLVALSSMAFAMSRMCGGAKGTRHHNVPHDVVQLHEEDVDAPVLAGHDMKQTA